VAPVHARQSALPPRPRTERSRRRLGALGVVALIASLLALSSTPAEASIEDELAAAQSKADLLAGDLIALQIELEAMADDIVDLEAEQQRVREEVGSLEEDVREIAVNRYVSAGNPPTIWTSDPLETARRDTLMGAVQADSNASLDAFRVAGERLQASSEALAERQEEQRSAQGEMTQALDDMQDELSRLAELQRQAELERARQEAERRQEEARRAAEAAARATTTTTPSTTTARPPQGSTSTPAPPPRPGPSPTTPPPTSPPATTTTTTTPSPPSPSGGVLCPVAGATSFANWWNVPRSDGRLHMGLDMFAALGTPAVAVVSGRVEHRGNSVGGLSYYLYGDDGNFYYGTHLSAYGAGGRVAAGTVIGYVGGTGNANGINHLHFEMHLGGRGNAVNPYNAVRAACR